MSQDCQIAAGAMFIHVWRLWQGGIGTGCTTAKASTTRKKTVSANQ